MAWVLEGNLVFESLWFPWFLVMFSSTSVRKLQPDFGQSWVPVNILPTKRPRSTWIIELGSAGSFRGTFVGFMFSSRDQMRNSSNELLLIRHQMMHADCINSWKMMVLRPKSMGYNPLKWRLWVPMVGYTMFKFHHKESEGSHDSGSGIPTM